MIWDGNISEKSAVKRLCLASIVAGSGLMPRIHENTREQTGQQEKYTFPKSLLSNLDFKIPHYFELMWNKPYCFSSCCLILVTFNYDFELYYDI